MAAVDPAHGAMMPACTAAVVAWLPGEKEVGPAP
jgi:hypothetical protein